MYNFLDYMIYESINYIICKKVIIYMHLCKINVLKIK